MIPRHQTVLFVILLLASVIMGAVLWNQLRRAHERLLRGQDAAPTQAPLVAPAEQATLMVANDADNSVLPRILTLPLPQNPEARARAVLGKLFDLYAAPDAAHSVPGGANSIAQVFLVPICATLNANLPRVTEVRFLVDGHTRATLAGHADLTRTYLATETVPTEGAHP